ncbi:MAG: hypothetical protein KA100_01490 [Rickettsiales bacterium]|nr:hypothetical protein [Rickettsiales bacterium]
MTKKILILLATLTLFSCGAISQVESPVIYFSNASLAPVRDIQCSWAGENLLTLPLLNPGESRSQSFYIGGASEFFGAINITWRNDKGERLIREFNFRENNLPSVNDSTTYNYVQFYLDQEELELVSSDAPDLAGKTRKMEKLLAQLKAAYAEGHTTTAIQTSLIRVQHIDPQKTRETPYWINNSF